jgi:Ni/Co efflux regulator RcnB
MNTKNTLLTVAAATLVLTGMQANAQSVDERKENQQQRIGQGIEKGQLTPGEAANLEKHEKAVNKEVRNDRKANGGKLTPAERQQANAQQNAMSKEIHTGRTNAVKPHYGNNEVDRRRENQQKRIGQGVASGQLTAGETARLEGQEAKINGQVRADRNANGGKLTPSEKRQVNGELNRESGRIYKQKHDGQKQ